MATFEPRTERGKALLKYLKSLPKGTIIDYNELTKRFNVSAVTVYRALETIPGLLKTSGVEKNKAISQEVKEAYNKLKKELKRNPTKNEVIRATGRNAEAINTAQKTFKLNFFNKPGVTAVPYDILKEANIKGIKVKRTNRIITEPTLQDGKLIFPNKEMEKQFKDEVRKKYKYPRDSVAAKEAGVLTQKDFYKKFYKIKSPSTALRDIGIMAKELNLKYPKQTYEGDLKQKKILEKRRTGLISDVSGKPEERKIVKAKREMGFGRSGKNLDLAHRASLKQFKDFGLPYLADNLGLDTRKVNQEIILPFEDEVNSLHKKRMKLIKNVKPGNVPIEVSKGLEVINKQLSDISMKTNGALQAVLIDEKTLKPFVFNKNYANVLGQGLIDKPVSQLTDTNIDFLKSTFSESSKQANKELNNLIKTAQGSPTACKAVLNKLVGGGVAGCVEEIKRNPTAAAEKISGLKPTSAALGKVRNAANAFLKFAGKGKGFAIGAGIGVGAGALVKKFMNDDPSTYLTNDKQANAMILDTIDQKERQERMDAIGDAPELLDEANIAANIAVTAAPIPGSAAVYAARRKPFTRIVDGVTKTRKAMGPVKAALGPVGKALSGFATPAGIAALTPLNVASSLYEGDSAYEIATDPLNYLGPALAGGLSKEATRGMNQRGLLARSLRLGMSPGAIKMVSRRFGLPGLALSAGISLYELADDYKSGRGMFGKKE